MSILSAMSVGVGPPAAPASGRPSSPSGRTSQLVVALAVAGAVALAGCSTSPGTHAAAAGALASAAAPIGSPPPSPSTASPSGPSTTSSTLATGTTEPPPATVRPAAENLPVTAAVRTQLVEAGAALNGLPGADYTGLVPGDTYYAYDPATATYWAGAALAPSPSSLRAQVSTQDDGSYLLFRRPPGQPWSAEDVGLAGIGGTTCSLSVPATVLAVWRWAPGSCRPGSEATTVARSPDPTLGQPAGDFALAARGFGQIEPSEIFNGGDPTGLVAHVVWSSWGGPDAVAAGISEYVEPNQIVAAGTEEPVTVVAFHLGTCDGRFMYQAVEWYFPQHSQAFDPSQYENICTGTYVPGR